MTETGAAEAPIAPRRWWLALPLAIFGAGAAGYLYLGRPRRAIVAGVLTLIVTLSLWTGLGGWLARPAVFFAVFATALIVGLFIIIDTIRIVRSEQAYVVRPYNRAWAYAVIVAVALLLAGFVQPAIRTFYIASASMQPTLREGDQLIVDTHALTPKREDLIVFALPRDPRIAYISRVMGIPGDRVQMVAGVFQINGVPVVLAKSDEPTPAGVEGAVYRETLPEGTSHLLIDTRPNGMEDDTGIVEIPPGLYFVMGDNRDNAADSRIPASNGGVGGVPTENIIGTVTAVYWSSDMSRIGKAIE